MISSRLPILRQQLQTIDAEIAAAKAAIEARYASKRQGLVERIEALEIARFVAETGLKPGAELLIGNEFINFENERGNDGQYWLNMAMRKGVPLRVYATAFNEWRDYHDIRVELDNVSVGGVPLEIVQRMRRAWVLNHPETEETSI